jgi:hypothetical protein
MVCLRRSSTVRVLRVQPIVAELWDGPSSSVVEASNLQKAAVTDQKPKLGENRQVTLSMR